MLNTVLSWLVNILCDAADVSLGRPGQQRPERPPCLLSLLGETPAPKKGADTGMASSNALPSHPAPGLGPDGPGVRLSPDKLNLEAVPTRNRRAR